MANGWNDSFEGKSPRFTESTDAIVWDYTTHCVVGIFDYWDAFELVRQRSNLAMIRLDDVPRIAESSIHVSKEKDGAVQED